MTLFIVGIKTHSLSQYEISHCTGDTFNKKLLECDEANKFNGYYSRQRCYGVVDVTMVIINKIFVYFL